MVPVRSAGASGSKAACKDSWAEDFDRRHCGGVILLHTLKEKFRSVITQSLTLADGRVVEVLLGGDPTGYPLRRNQPCSCQRAFDFPFDRFLSRLSGEATSALDVAHAR